MTSHEYKLPVNFIREGDTVIAYRPILDLSSCGKNEAEAEQMFHEAFRLFVKTCIEMGTLEEVLTDCGWELTDPSSSYQTDGPLDGWVAPQVTTREVALTL